MRGAELALSVRAQLTITAEERREARASEYSGMALHEIDIDEIVIRRGPAFASIFHRWLAHAGCWINRLQVAAG